MFDRADAQTGISSMARATGYTATAAVRMLAEGLFDDHGIIPPEHLGRRPECVDIIINNLKDRGVVYHRSVESPDS
jgi:saccharopine dehydrogenase-like NADP-dependent oxidoreductase